MGHTMTQRLPVSPCCSVLSVCGFQATTAGGQEAIGLHVHGAESGAFSPLRVSPVALADRTGLGPCAQEGNNHILVIISERSQNRNLRY